MPVQRLINFAIVCTLQRKIYKEMKILKQKITITDTVGVSKSDVINIPNKMHFETQLKTRMNIFKNKKVYSRKQKYKRKDY